MYKGYEAPVSIGERKDVRNERFRSLVANLFDRETVFGEAGDDHILDAVQDHKVVFPTSGPTLLALVCLVTLYEKLGKDEPDEESIVWHVEELKKYLYPSSSSLKEEVK